jgi:Fe-S cluster assembly protein SufD
MNTQAVATSKEIKGLSFIDGLLRIPAGMVAEEPIPVSAFLSGSEDTPLQALAVEIGAGARATVLVRYETGAGESGLARSALALRLEQGAELHIILTSATPASLHRDSVGSASLAEGAVLRWTEAIFDEGRGRYTTTIDLEGRGAQVDFAGAYTAASSTWREHALSENHLAPATRSRALLKSALRDSSHLLFSGLIRVDPAAPGTDAYLSNRNLLLDDGARAESLPQLKIETDDVACTHGSTTGGPREEELFYLMSRGLDRLTSRSLLAIGHLGGVLDRAPEALAAELENTATRALNGETNLSSPSAEGAA